MGVNPQLLFAQNAPLTTIATVGDAVAGQQVIVPVTVAGFTSIGSFSLTVDYDVTKLQYVSGIQNPLLSGVFNMGDNNLGSDMHRIVMGWFGSGSTLADGSWLVNLKFIYLSGSVDLEWYEMGPSCEYSDQFANVLNDSPTSTYYINGKVCATLPTPGPVTGNNNVCQGLTGVSYNIAPVGNVNGYNWTVPPGASIVSGINTDSITVDYSLTASTGDITVSGSNDCGNGPVSVLPVTVNAHPLANAGNDTTIGYATSVQLHAASGGTGVFAYHWSPEALLVNPDVQNPFTVQLTSTAIFHLSVSDLSGLCQSIDDVSVNVTGSPLIASPTVVPGSICRDQYAQLSANVNGGSGNYIFNWTSDPPGNPAWSSAMSNPFVSPDTTTLYILSVSDGFNSFTGSTSLHVFQLPSAMVSGGGETCANGDLLTVQVDLTGTPPWSFTMTNGSNSFSLSNIYISPYLINTSDPGLYNVTTVQDLNCFGNSMGSAGIVVNPVPPTPFISLNGYILSSDIVIGNQWFKDGQVILNANGQTYLATENGQYLDVVTLNGCLSDSSNRINLITTNNETFQDHPFQLYPNPARDFVILKTDKRFDIYPGLDIITCNGTQVRDLKIEKGASENEWTIKTSTLLPGLYVLRIFDGFSMHVSKLLIN